MMRRENTQVLRSVLGFVRAEGRPCLNGGIDLSLSKSVCLQAPERKQMGTEAGRLGDVVVRIHGLSFLFASILSVE